MVSNRLEIAKRVNSEVNQGLQYMDDSERWGKVDYWPTSRELAAMLSGQLGPKAEDCDGFAIAKAMLLWDVWGFSQDELRLLICWVPTGSPSGAWAGHMTLLYLGDNPGDPWLLDNGGITQEVVRYSQVMDGISPFIEFNREKIWRLIEV